MSFGDFDFEAPKEDNCIRRLCTNPLGDPPPPTHTFNGRIT